MFFRSSVIQNFVLLASPVIVIPTLFGTLECVFDHYYSRYVDKNYKKSKGVITGAGVIKVNRTQKGYEEISLNETRKKENSKFSPKLEYKYMVDEKLFRNGYSFYKRPEFKTFEEARSFLDDVISTVKGSVNRNNQVDILISHRNNKFSRLINPKTFKMYGIDGKDEISRRLKRNLLQIGGITTLLGTCYYTATPNAKQLGKKVFLIGVLVNAMFIAFVTRRKIKDQTFSLKSFEVEE